MIIYFNIIILFEGHRLHFLCEISIYKSTNRVDTVWITVVRIVLKLEKVVANLLV